MNTMLSSEMPKQMATSAPTSKVVDVERLA
jgi:hypothetical protein